MNGRKLQILINKQWRSSVHNVDAYNSSSNNHDENLA